jgi:hypothetical protein
MSVTRLLSEQGVAFDSPVVEAMCAAFDDVCQTLAIGREAIDLRNKIALLIISLASDGEIDPGRFRHRVLQQASNDET